MNLYFIPGLGFDHRIFERLQLPGYTGHYLDWIEPDHSREPIQTYARRLAESIDPAQPIVLIGHSMGGIMAQEIARFLPVQKIILLGSIRSRQEMPWLFRCLAPLGIPSIFSKSFVLRTFPFWGKQHGYVTKTERDLFKSMVNQLSDTYLNWALWSLSNWQKKTPVDSIAVTPPQIHQIHGSHDKTFPSHLLTSPDQLIEGAGHFMVFRRAEEVSERILVSLENRQS